LVNNWFQRQKGLAMSTYQAIDSFLPALLVPVVALSIALWGWQPTSTVLGIILLAIIIPLSFLIRNNPESMGLPMDGVPRPRPTQDQAPPPGGRPASHAAVTRAAPQDEYTVAAAMRTPAYWVLVTATALRLVAKGAITVHIIPILVSKGVDAKTAAFIFGLLLFVSVPFYLGVGWLSDRHPKRLVMAVACAAGTVSFALLALPLHSLWPIFLFVFLFAIADASAPVNWALLGDYFGTKTFSTLRGYVQMANFPGVFLAPVFVGWWYDQHQSYTLPLWMFTAVFALGAVTFMVTRQPRRLGTQAVPVGREAPG
jgi:sugar phosphate permease